MSGLYRKIFSAWKKPRLSREILFWLALTGLFPFVILVLPQYFFAEATLIDHEKQALNQALNSRVYQVEKWLDEVRQDLDFIAASSCVLEKTSNPSQIGDSLYCPVQEAVIRSHRAYRAIQKYGQRGELLSSSGDGDGCLPFPSEDRFARISARKAGLYIAPDCCFENGSTFVIAGKMVRRQAPGEAKYILALLDLNQAIKSMFTTPFLVSGKFYIISSAGQYLYPPGNDPSLNGSMIRQPKQFLGGTEGEVREYYDSNRKLVLGAFRQVPGTKWLLVKEVDKDVVIDDRKAFAQRSLLAGIATLGVIFFGSSLVARRLTKPLEELAAAANSISLGETGNWRKAPEFSQQEVDQVGKAFNEMLDRIGDSEKALVKAASLAAIGEFSAKIVHDIRSPLSSINLALRSLAKSTLEEKDRQRVAIAREQAGRLMIMADGLLSYGRPLQLKLEKFTLGQLLDELMSAVGPDLEAKGLELRLPESESREILLRGDRELLLQALTNLVNNAAQWSPARAIIELEGRPVSEPRRGILLRISDSGPGFNQKTLAKIFQPFFTTREKGTGLGLANAKKIIDYHGGTISAANRPAGGAEIIITLPISTRPENA